MPRARHVLTVLVAAILTLASTSLGQWPKEAPEPQPGSEIRAVEIHVLDPPTKKVLAEVRPGEILTLNRGDTVRLRMVALPQQGGPRYPSARLELVSGTARLRVLDANVEVGNLLIIARRPDNPPAPREATVVRYEIVDREIRVPAELTSGSIEVEVVEPEPAEEPAGELEGIVFYTGPGFAGTSARFRTDRVDDLDDSAVGRQARSVRIAYGCEAVLYPWPQLQGNPVRIARDVEDLATTQLGERPVSSFTMDCSVRDAYRRQQTLPGAGEAQGRGEDVRERLAQTRRRGVTLYADPGFRGTSETFTADRVATLRSSRIGSDQASSVRVDAGCQAVLYEHPDFRGRSLLVSGEIGDLGQTRIGTDTVSSLTVSCER